MVVLLYAFYQHVVYVNLHIPSNLVCEHSVHQPLVRGSCVLKSEWHYFVAEKSLASNKRSLLLISLIQFGLVVTRECVHEV